MAFMVLAIGGMAVLSLAIIIEVRQHQQINACKDLSALTDEDRQLLQVSRIDNYHEAVRLLRQLRLIDKNGLAVLNKNIWDFNLECLAKALGKFWHLRWPKLPAAKRKEEISRVANDLTLEFNDDLNRLEQDLIAVIRWHYSDIAEFLKAEISEQLKKEG